MLLRDGYEAIGSPWEMVYLGRSGGGDFWAKGKQGELPGYRSSVSREQRYLSFASRCGACHRCGRPTRPRPERTHAITAPVGRRDSCRSPLRPQVLLVEPLM